MGVYLGQSVYNDSQVTPEWVEEEIAKNGKGVFWVDYNQTTYSEINSAYAEDKILILREFNPGGYGVYAYLFNSGSTGNKRFITQLDENKEYTIYTITNQNVWSKEKTSTLPNITPSDDEKFLQVIDEQLKLDYLPAIKFGVESPLKFKKDTLKENVIGFDTSSNNCFGVATVQRNGDVIFEEPKYKKFGVYNDFLSIEEDETKLIIRAKQQFILIKVGETTFNDVKNAYENGFCLIATSLSMAMNRTFLQLLQVTENSIRFYFGAYSIIDGSMIGCSVDTNGWTALGPI